MKIGSLKKVKRLEKRRNHIRIDLEKLKEIAQRGEIPITKIRTMCPTCQLRLKLEKRESVGFGKELKFYKCPSCGYEYQILKIIL